MSVPESFQIRPLSEADLDFVLETAGGVRAHQSADRRSKVGADYKLGGTLIELKGLDEEGFTKISRQEKLAALFREYEPERPVIVLDRRRLKPEDQARFDRIIEGPIKTAIAKANRQLKQSRAEHADATCSVLLVINNGYTTLDHKAFTALVAHRVQQDTHQIDVVVVAGVYYHSDGYESYLLWPIECVPINLGRRFAEFEQLRAGWEALGDRFMSQLVQGAPSPDRTKAPIADTQFEMEGVTYIRPAPAIGGVSEFYVHGRPRRDSSVRVSNLPVARTFPDLTRTEWSHLEKLVAYPSDILGSYDAWKRVESEAKGTPTCPFVTVPITANDWKAWCLERGEVASIFQFANEIFNQRVRILMAQARELKS